ncbi:MAG: hypothetical protein J7K81_00180 [Methanophagales archaeon]|nr:hypothetical protein [Methanophagales archaeon]
MRGFGSHGILRFPKFKSKVNRLIRDVKNDGAMFPGEIEEIKEEQNREGIEIQDEIYNEFKEVVVKHYLKIKSVIYHRGERRVRRVLRRF